jgi:hypothetical protein
MGSVDEQDSLFRANIENRVGIHGAFIPIH